MFELDDKQINELQEWREEHDRKCKFSKPDSCGAIGGRFTYCFTPTGLGVLTSVRCACGAEVNLTDTNDW